LEAGHAHQTFVGESVNVKVVREWEVLSAEEELFVNGSMLVHGVSYFCFGEIMFVPTWFLWLHRLWVMDRSWVNREATQHFA